MLEARDRLIVALDLPSATEAKKLVARLDGVASFFKVGLELYTAAGPDLVRSLIADGKKVFLDLKFLDIEETVRRAVEQVVRLGVSFTTVHESGKTVAAALRGSEGSPLKILAVTLLTSMDERDLRESGISLSVEELVLHRAKRAMAAGCHGVVASAQEARKLRALDRGLNKEVIIVTPGIRRAGSDAHEQKRTMTPAEAIQAGSDYLVVGRPIRDAADPRLAAQQILGEMQRAFAPPG